MKRKLLICLMFLATAGIMNGQTFLKKITKENFHPKVEKQIAETKMARALNRSVVKSTKADDQSTKELTLAYCDQDENGNQFTMRKTGVQKMAANIKPAMVSNFVGNKVTKIRFALFDIATISDISVWIAPKISSNPVVEQVVSNISKGWNEVTLNTPYDIDGKGFYIGYTLTCNSTQAYPFGVVQLGDEITSGAFCYYADGKWVDYTSETSQGVMGVQLQCVAEGPNMPKTDIEFKGITYGCSVAGDDIRIAGYLINKGCDVKSMDISYTTGNEAAQSVKATVIPSIRYNSQGEFDFTIPNNFAAGIHDLKVTITKINGDEDTKMSNNTLNTELTNMSSSLAHKTVVEEGTATWNGLSVGGIAKMKQMKEKFPNTFVGMSVHWGNNEGQTDPMHIEKYYPIVTSKIRSLPNALFDRSYLGDTYDEMEYYYQGSQEYPCEASIALATQYTNNEKTEVSITSSVKFNLSHSSTPYRIAYAVVEDGVTGYKQANSYNKDELIKLGIKEEQIAELPEDLQFYVNSPAIMDMTFNNVVRDIHDCMGIEGSFSGAIVENEAKTHTYTITLPNNIQNKDNIRIIALLIREYTGRIVNAEQVKVGESVNINNVNTSKFNATINVTDGALNITANETATAELYSINGTQITTATINGSATIPVAGLKGVYIARVNNGNDVVIKKVIF